MITLLIKSYLTILLPVAIGSALLFIAGLCWIIGKNPAKNPIKKAATLHYTANDLTAITGDDVFATQLDLARAYIETDKKELAKTILEVVIEQGSALQQQEAQQLLNYTV